MVPKIGVPFLVPLDIRGMSVHVQLLGFTGLIGVV